MSTNDSQKVILVDDKDMQIGLEDKLKAHQNGAKLHRAISILVFNSKGDTLLQQRAMGKYHSQGKWANTCCTHPMPGESLEDCAHRRLREEMGFDCKLNEVFSFIYKADVGNGLTEHEYDHVFFGVYEGEPKPNSEEVMNFRWVSLEKLKQQMVEKPDDYAPWLRMCLDRAIEAYNKKKP